MLQMLSSKLFVPACFKIPSAIHRFAPHQVSATTLKHFLTASHAFAARSIVREYHQESEPDWNCRDDLFNFTRARFFRNEEEELAKRRVKFDMNELASLSAKAAGSAKCIKVEKCPDGQYSKAYVMTMEDGKQVIAKVPNPNAGPAVLTTASEVATMDFVRDICGTPVPKVLAWNCKAKASPVGAEYIIMEKAEGVPLSSVWNGLRIDKKFEIIKTLASFQKNWMSITFRQYGSLYFAKDIPDEVGSLGSPSLEYLNGMGVEVRDSRFKIGPTVNREFFDHGRSKIEFDRGPWNTVEEYCIAVVDREIACVKAVAVLPKPPLTLVGRYIPTRVRKLAVLDLYKAIVKFLIPSDSAISASHIWHSDLHDENIFVNPNNPTEVVGIIDWQSIGLVPFFENIHQPGILDYAGPPVNGLETPEQPEGHDSSDPVQRAKAFKLEMSMMAVVYYRNLVYQLHEPLYKAIEFRETLSHSMLTYARNVLLDGEAIYHDRIANELRESWHTLPNVQAMGSPAYPFKFSEAEMAAIKREAEAMSGGIMCMLQIQEDMGDLFPADDCISHEKYEAAKREFKAWKEALLEQFARNDDERAALTVWWPFIE